MTAINRRVLIVWILVFAWLGVVLAASGDSLSFSRSSRILRPLLEWLFPNLPEERMWAIVLGVRKLAHVSEYCLLALLARRAWRLTWLARGLALGSFRLAVLAFCFAVASASLDEYRQSLTRTRHGSVWDVLLDASGAALGLVCLGFFSKWKARRSAAAALAAPVPLADVTTDAGPRI